MEYTVVLGKLPVEQWLAYKNYPREFNQKFASGKERQRAIAKVFGGGGKKLIAVGEVSNVG